MSVREGFPGAGRGSAWLCPNSLEPCGPGEGPSTTDCPLAEEGHRGGAECAQM